MNRKCFLCGSVSNEIYTNLQDRQSVSTDKWSYLKCKNSDCELIWLHPTPNRQILEASYSEDYYTHETQRDSIYRAALNHIYTSRIGRQLGFLNFLHGVPKGTLLDVGCGDGRYMQRMQGFGWSVEGVEPDANATAHYIESIAANVYASTLADASLGSSKYDAITLNHVIEHVEDPISLLSECFRILKPGGFLVLNTPNSNSLGHHNFGRAWVALDVPRHIFIYSVANLKRMLEDTGFTVVHACTSARGARGIYIMSKVIQEHGYIRSGLDVSMCIKAKAILFLLLELIVIAISKGVGEEIAVICKKRI